LNRERGKLLFTAVRSVKSISLPEAEINLPRDVEFDIEINVRIVIGRYKKF
jgi:tRNA U54 and U55 pseudouridine synthase Pus10